MDNEVLENEEIVEIEIDNELAEDGTEIEVESPDVDLDIKLMEKIRSMFDAGSTRSIIAKELGLEREDVIEVLSKYVTRSKINGKNTQVVDFKFNPEGKTRIELGDRLHTSIYVKDGDDIEAAKKKWLKILNNDNE